MEQLIFVYGTLKENRHNHHYIGESELVGKCLTEPVYTMKTYGSFPIVEREGNTSITGEVYNVINPNTLEDIYRLEGYKGTPGHARNWYDIDVIDTPYGEAYIFVMPKDKNPNLPVIESGIF